jgi:hypothetical protein
VRDQRVRDGDKETVSRMERERERDGVLVCEKVVAAHYTNVLVLPWELAHWLEPLSPPHSG